MKFNENIGIKGVILSLLLISFLVGYSQNKEVILKAGFAETDITPDIGMEHPGGYGKSYHRNFNDRCKVRSAVFDDGESIVAIVGLDLLLIRKDIVDEIREAISNKTTIQPEAIMIGATHSHSSGPIGMHDEKVFENSSNLVKELVNDYSISSNPGFIQHMKNQIIQSVIFAYNKRQEAKLAVGVGFEDKVSFNRRLRMKNGLTFSHPGAGNPDIIDYAGPIDPDVGTIGVWDLNGNLIGVIVNFANHNTTNPSGISANWVGAMEDAIRGATGNHALPVICMPGACGDITQVDNLTKFQNPAGAEWREIVGGRIGAEAFKTLLLIRRGASSDIPIAFNSKTLQISRRSPSKEKIKKAIETVNKPLAETDHTEWTFAKETVILEALVEADPVVQVEIQTIKIGPAVFVSNPAEYFVEYGLEIKKNSKFPFTFVVGLANGCVGYVPTEEAFGKNGGGYETRLTSYSNLEITAGKKIALTSIELINKMEPGKTPAPPPAKYSGNPWSYGNVPPELN